MAVLWWCHISRAWGGSGWGCDATPPRCTHRVRSCEERRDDTPLQIWFYLWNSLCLNLYFLTSAGRIRTPAAGKQHDVISRCFCSLGNLIECRLQSTPIEEVQFSLYNSLTKILPNIKWGNVAPLTSITGFFPTIRSAEHIIATVSISGSSSFLLIGNRFVPGAKRSRGWHLFSNHSLRRLCPSQWGKNHTPDQGALKAWKEYYASAEQSVVVHIHRLRLGPGLDVWETEGNLDAPMTFLKPIQVI